MKNENDYINLIIKYGANNMEKYCSKCGYENKERSQFCSQCGQKLDETKNDENNNELRTKDNETEATITETEPNKVNDKSKKRAGIIGASVVGLIALVIFGTHYYNKNTLADEAEQSAPEEQLSQSDGESSEVEETQPLLFDPHPNYQHGSDDPILDNKVFENPESYTYLNTYETFEDMYLASLDKDNFDLLDAPLSAVLTKINEPQLFYIYDSVNKAVEDAVLLYVLLFDNKQVTTYPLYPNNFSESNPDTVLKMNDFIGISTTEAIQLVEKTHQQLFDLTIEDILSQHEHNEDIVYQYSQLEYIAPIPQPFELLFTDNYVGQVIKKYTQIQLSNEGATSDLLNQLEDFNDYVITYNLLHYDRFISALPNNDEYAITGFRTNETGFGTIYKRPDLRTHIRIRFDDEHTTDIEHEDLKLVW